MRKWARALGLTYEFTWLGLFLWLLFYLAVYALYAYSLMRFPFDYDQGEGYDVNSAWALAQGLSIYASPDDYPFYSSNYPPLYSLLLAPLVGAFGPQLPLGRLLSLVAVAVSVLLIVRAVLTETGRGRPAIAAGLFFLASPYVYHVTPLARVNALMVALSLAGMYVIARSAAAKYRAGNGWLVLGGVFLLAALYTKQMALDAVAASVVFLALRDWRRGLALAAGIGGVGGALYLAIDWFTGGGFSLNVLWANANPFSWDQALMYYRNFLQIHLLVVVVALAVTARDLIRHGPAGLSVYSLYFLAALVVALGTGKWGAGESYFLPAIAAACVILGTTLGRLEDVFTRYDLLGQTARAGRGTVLALGACAAVLAAFGLVQLPLLWHGALSRPELGLYDRGLQASVLGRRPNAADVAAGLRVTSYLQNAPGDVLAEESAFALVAGRRVLGNATQQRNLWQAGLHDPSALVTALERGDVSVVVLNAQQYPSPVLQAIGQNCYAVETVEMNGFRYMVLLSGRRGG